MPLPNLILIGSQKSGTTTLTQILKKSDDVCSSRPNEPHYFDIHYGKGEDFYHSFFDHYENEQIIFEKSPYYIFHPYAPKRIKETLGGNTKFLVMLRDPVERLLSQFYHEKSMGFEDVEKVEEALEKEENFLQNFDPKNLEDPNFYSYEHQHFTYFSRGKYKEQIENWFQHFNKENFFFIDFNDYVGNELKYIKDVIKFGGGDSRSLDTSLPSVNQKSKKDDLPKELREHLENEYKRHNHGLNELTGVEFSWNK